MKKIFYNQMKKMMIKMNSLNLLIKIKNLVKEINKKYLIN